MNLNPRSWWQSVQRRRVENDVRVHPDTGSLPHGHARQKPVRGARQALRQIDAEAPMIGLPEMPPTHVFAAASLDWVRDAIVHFSGQADDARTAALENWEREAMLRARVADLEAWLRIAEAPASQPEPFANGLLDVASLRSALRCQATIADSGTILECTRAAGHDDDQRPGYEGYWSRHFNPVFGEWGEPASSSSDATRTAYMGHLEQGAAPVAHDEVLDERMFGMGDPATVVPSSWWRPEPTEIPGGRDGDTHTVAAYEHTGGAL